LEVIQEVGVPRTSRHGGGKQLASELLLLRSALTREVHEGRIKEKGIDVALFPAGVEVEWMTKLPSM
jgi:hypothetical protein